MDTNVVSELSKPVGDSSVISWLDRQPPKSLFLTAISVAEMLSGVAKLPEGRRKTALSQSVEEAIIGMGTPVLPFDHHAAHKFAELVLIAKTNQYTLSLADGYIAAIAALHGASIATRDVHPFQAAGIPVINPWNC